MSDRSDASFTRRSLALGARVTTTALTGLVAAGLVALATGAIATRAAERPLPPAAPLPFVASQAIAMTEGFEVARQFTGQIEAAAEVAMGFEAGGTLAAVLVEDGAQVAAGDVIARLDTRTLEAERNAQRALRDAIAAQLELAIRTAARAEALGDSGFATDQRRDEAGFAVAELRARIAEIEAGLETIAIALDKSVLRAPFAGRAANRAVDPGQTIAAGSPLVTLYADAAPELHVGLPPALAAGLSPDTQVTAQIMGQIIPARFDRLSPNLDPATRTQTAIFTLEAQNLPLGQTGRITLSLQVPEPGFWAPSTALTAGPDQTWRIQTITNDQIATVAVEVLQTDGDRVFLRASLPQDARLVPTGAHRFVTGEAVRTE